MKSCKKVVYGQERGRHGEGDFGVAHPGASCAPIDIVSVVLRPAFQGSLLSVAIGYSF